MGRNKKQGLDYFPFDIDFFQDLKIRKLIKQQGGKAITVYALLLCIIYKDGYYMEWDEELPFVISEQTGFDEVYIREVIKSCLSVGLFSKELYLSDKILTSAGIQERYENISKLSKRKARIIEYCLISSEEMPITSEESAQRKVKKSKVNKNSLSLSPSHEVESGGEQATGVPSQRERDLFFEILFFRNIKDPDKEVQRFIDHYQANGWRRAGGAKIADRAAVCRQWKPQEENAKRFPQEFVEALHAFYAEHRDVRLLYSIERIETKDGIVIIYFADKFGADFIGAHYSDFTPVIQAMGCTHLARQVKRQRQ